MSSKPSAIVLSIGNTITDRNFFSRGLFPFLRNNVGHFLRKTSGKSTTQKMIDRLRTAQERLQGSDNESDSSKCNKVKGVERIPSKDGSSEDIACQCVQFVQWLAEQHPLSVELKELRLLMWTWAIESRLISGHVFEEVADCLHRWKHKHDIRICVYSQAHFLMQQLHLVHCDNGNLLSLIECFFDLQWGSKNDPNTYENIAAHLQLPPNKVLYLTDSLLEANSATQAGLNVAIVKRDGKKQKQPGKKVIGALDELAF